MRAFAAVWGGWLIVTGLVFSYMQGIIHPYYMVALGPAIGALVGVGAISLWQARLGWAGRVTAVAAVLVTAWWSYELLDRSPDWLPWLRWTVVVAGVVTAVALVAAGLLVSQFPARRGLAGGPRRVLLDEEAGGLAFDAYSGDDADSGSDFGSGDGTDGPLGGDRADLDRADLGDADLGRADLYESGRGAAKGWVPVCGRESIPVRHSPAGLPDGLSAGPKAVPAGFSGGAVSVRRRWDSAGRARLAGTAAAVATGAALVAGLGGPLAYTLDTVTPRTPGPSRVRGLRSPGRSAGRAGAPGSPSLAVASTGSPGAGRHWRNRRRNRRRDRDRRDGHVPRRRNLPRRRHRNEHRERGRRHG